MRAFTLVELLTVIAVLAILVSITVGISRGMQERAAFARAKADLAVLADALEQYKLQYGDYPWTPDSVALDGGAILFNALTGSLGPKATLLPARGRTFVDLARFNLASKQEADLPQPGPPAIVTNWFNDPWAKQGNTNWYYYVYRPKWAPGGSASWSSPSYLLYSHGPDGDCDIGPAKDTGLVSDVPVEARNEDNLYAGRDS